MAKQLVSLSRFDLLARGPGCPSASANGMEPSSLLSEITSTEFPKQLVRKAPALTPDCLTDWEE